MSDKNSRCIVRLMGGLGNQMFQYALGQRLMADHGCGVSYDTMSAFKNDTYNRRFALGGLDASVAPARAQDIPRDANWPSPWHRLARITRFPLSLGSTRFVYERKPFQFDRRAITHIYSKTYYIGYWQNEKYIQPIANQLIADFHLRGQLRQPIRMLINEMESCRAISLHARRYNDVGRDGKVLIAAQNRYGVCSPQYFTEALARIGTPLGSVCYVFSDDLEWAKANLLLGVPCRYVADVCQCSDTEELFLMTHCQHHVISNSSFSWWGAWLGRNPGKIIVAPKVWMRSPLIKSSAVCPDAWIRL
jgi:hypothetical protein